MSMVAKHHIILVNAMSYIIHIFAPEIIFYIRFLNICYFFVI